MESPNVEDKLDAFRREVDRLRRAADEVTAEAEGPTDADEAHQALLTALEEMGVAEEELRQQNEELISARAAVEAERRRYQDLFESAPDGYLVTDEAGVIQEANRAAAALLGVPADHLRGKPIATYVASGQRGMFWRVVDRLRTAEEIDQWELQLQPRRGEAFPASVSVVAVREPAGEVAGMRWIIRDVTERVRMEQAVGRRERELYALADNVPAIVARFGRDLRHLYVNPAVTHATGRDPEEFIGRTHEEMGMPADLCELFDGALREVFETGQPQELEFSLASPDGERWFSGRVVPERSPEGTVETALCLTRDVTDEKRAWEALTQSERRYRQLAELSPDAIFLLVDGRAVFVNAAAVRLFGLERAEDLLGRPALELLHPDDRDRAAEALRRIVEEGETQPFSEWRLVRPDGSMAFVEAAACRIEYQGGAAIQGAARDVTRRREAEEALRRHRDELEHQVSGRTVDLRLAYDELETERRRLYDVLNMIPAFVYLRGPDYRIRFANRQFEEEFGIHEGRACHEILHGRSDPCPACVASEVLATGEGRAQEMTFVNGRTYELHDYPFVDADGSELILRLGVDVTERRRLEREVAEASRMEQRRIGQDLHDTLGQELTGIAFQSKALAMKLARGSGEGAEEAQLISETVRRAIDQTRALARGLCPVETGAQGLMTALDELATSTRKLYGVDCVFECPAPVRIADHAVATHAYQIAREAVTNAVRHGKPKKVTIRLAGADGMVRLEVSDDGTGMAKDMTEDAGMGLRIMKHRAAVIGGALDVQTAPREGTTVTCVFRPPAAKPSGS